MKDLTARMTAFVTTVGAPTFNACIHGLRQQDCQFGLTIIDRVAPMSRAFQLMLDRCVTPYYVQVDEDMLLYPHAMRTLFEHIDNEPSSTAAYQFPLYDVFLGSPVYGVKIFRHQVAKRYSFRNVDGCDLDQVLRMQRDGYLRVRAPLETATREGGTSLGLHGTWPTPRSIYDRFRTEERKRRQFAKGSSGLEDLHTFTRVPELGARLLRRFLAHGSESDLFAILGILSGRLVELEDGGQEKDYRTYDRLPGLEAALRFAEDARQPMERVSDSDRERRTDEREPAAPTG